MARGGSSTVAADQASNRLLTQRFGRIRRVGIGSEAALWVAAVLRRAALAPLAVREVRTMRGG
jgi:hypothetical protein